MPHDLYEEMKKDNKIIALEYQVELLKNEVISLKDQIESLDDHLDRSLRDDDEQSDY